MITTIIPTFRRPKLLLRALRSAQQQNVPGHTILILDNASGDETLEIVQKEAQRDPRIEIISHKTNIGALSNFIYGYNSTKTQYFNFLSDDDLLLPNFYENAVSALAKYPDAGMYASSTIQINELGEINRVSLNGRKDLEYWPKNESIFEFLKGDFSPWTSVVFNKRLTEAVGGPSPIFHIDEELILKMILHYPCIASSHLGAIYVGNPNSFSSNSNRLAVLNLKEELIRSESLYINIDKESKNHVLNVFQRENVQAFRAIFFKFLTNSEYTECANCLDSFEKWHDKIGHLRTVLALSKFKPITLLFKAAILLRKHWYRSKNALRFAKYKKFLDHLKLT